MREPPTFLAMLGNKVVARIGRTVAWRPVAHLKVRSDGGTSVYQAVSGPLMREADAVAHSHEGFSLVVNQHNLSINHENKLVLDRVPMEQGRGGSRLEGDKVDPKGSDGESVAEHALIYSSI